MTLSPNDKEQTADLANLSSSPTTPTPSSLPPRIQPTADTVLPAHSIQPSDPATQPRPPIALHRPYISTFRYPPNYTRHTLAPNYGLTSLTTGSQLRPAPTSHGLHPGHQLHPHPYRPAPAQRNYPNMLRLANAHHTHAAYGNAYGGTLGYAHPGPPAHHTARPVYTNFPNFLNIPLPQPVPVQLRHILGPRLDAGINGMNHTNYDMVDIRAMTDFLKSLVKPTVPIISKQAKATMPKVTTKEEKPTAVDKADKPPVKRRVKKDKDPLKPKRALSAYMFFVQDYRERIKSENPDVTFGEVGRLLGAKWKEMTPAEKKPYEDQAEQDKVRAAKQKGEYIAINGKPKPVKKSAKTVEVDEEDDDEEDDE